MKHVTSNLLISILLCTPAQPVLAELPSKIQSSYDVIGFGMTLANINETFTRDKENYHIESVTKAIGLLARFKPETVRVVSDGKITAQGLVPQSYSLKREVDTDKNASAIFNWEKSVLTQTDYKGVNDLTLSKGAQDRLSVLYNLPILANTGVSDFAFSITDGNNLEKYNFTLAPEIHNTRVPLGQFKTRFISNPPISTEIKYEIWMAIDKYNFPCKIIATDSNGGKLTQVLTDLTIVP